MLASMPLKINDIILEVDDFLDITRFFKYSFCITIYSSSENVLQCFAIYVDNQTK